MKLLTNKEYVTKTNNWYAPLSEFWEKYKSIYAAKLNYPGDGFTFYTMEVPFYVGTVDEKNLIDNIELCYNQI